MAEGFFQKFFRGRRRNKAWDEAYELKKAGRYAEAAAVYDRIATESLGYNELIYADDCHDAFKLWLKANNPDKAMGEARNALQVLTDAGWPIKTSSTVEDLEKMVGNFMRQAMGLKLLR
jgi:hypothetical protein